LTVSIALRNVSNVYQCPTPNCKNRAEIAPDLIRFVCAYCQIVSCTKCKITPFHEEKTCEEYQAERQDIDDADQKLFEDFAGQEGFKKCPRCSTWVEKTFGCNHMICPNPQCSADFCYQCEEFIDGKNLPAHYDPHHENNKNKNKKDVCELLHEDHLLKPIVAIKKEKKNNEQKEERLELDVSRSKNDTIHHIKFQIPETWHIPIEKQQLKYKNVVLENNDIKLKDKECKFELGDEMVLTVLN